jgi:hypothetical protein
VTTLKDATPVGNEMPYIVMNGTYTAFLNGDVNDDGIVDIHDAMYLAKYELDKPGYAMCLAKHVIGISGYAELK